MRFKPQIEYLVHLLRPWVPPADRRWRFGLLLLDGRQIGLSIRGKNEGDVANNARAEWHRHGPRGAEGCPVLRLCESIPPEDEAPAVEWLAVRCFNCGKQVAQVRPATSEVYLSGVGGHIRRNKADATRTARRLVFSLPPDAPIGELVANLPGAVYYTQATPVSWDLEVPIPAGADPRTYLKQRVGSALDVGEGSPQGDASRVAIACDRCKEQARWTFLWQRSWAACYIEVRGRQDLRRS